MKKLITLAVVTVCLAFSSVTYAQNKTKSSTKDQSKKESSQGKDKISKDKVGPNGEQIYVTTVARYYWIDDKGVRHYVEEVELKPKQ